MWMPLIILVFATAITASLRVNIDENQYFVEEARVLSYKTAISDVGAGIEQFLLENARYPNDLIELFSQHSELGQYRHLVDYSVITLNDSELDRQYQKAIIFIKADKYESVSSWLSANDCGSQSFAAGFEFCKKDGSFFAVTDNRMYQQYLASETIARLDYLSQQIFNGRTAKGSFANVLVNGNEMNKGDVVTLSFAVNYSDTPNNCSGVREFDSAVISCEFLFSLSGSPIYYIFNDDSNVILYVDLPVLHIDGTPHRIARPLRVF